MRLQSLIIVAALAFASSSAAQVPDGPRPDDGYFQRAQRVAPGVWVLAQPRFQVQPAGNVSVIEQDDGLILVDCGGSPGAARRVVAIVKSLSAKPVKAVIITHWHGDHAQGLDQILQAWPQARTIATRTTQAHLSDPRTMNTPAIFDSKANGTFQAQTKGFVPYASEMASKAPTPADKAGWEAATRLFRQYAADMDGAVTLPVREGFDDRLDLPDRHTPARALFLGRANTDGDALVWLPKQRVLITGDVVVAPFPYGYGSYPSDWMKTLTLVRALPFDTLVPGHGQTQHDQRYIDQVAAALADVQAQVAAIAKDDLRSEVLQSRIDADAPAQSFAPGDPWLKHWIREFWLRPIAASAYKEAKGRPIVQNLRAE